MSRPAAGWWSIAIPTPNTTRPSTRLAPCAGRPRKAGGKGGDAAGGERLEFVRLDGEAGAGQGEVHALRTDDDGTFEVVLPPGRYRVQARELDRSADTLAEVEAERGVTRTLRLTLPR